VSRLVSSPLGRACDTAAALGLELSVEVDSRWIEVDYGELEAQPEFARVVINDRLEQATDELAAIVREALGR